MTPNENALRKKERAARLKVWMAGRSSRNKTLIDKACRFLIARATKVEPEKDFLRDPLIDEDLGFDADELERFQQGKTQQWESR